MLGLDAAPAGSVALLLNLEIFATKDTAKAEAVAAIRVSVARITFLGTRWRRDIGIGIRGVDPIPVIGGLTDVDVRPTLLERSSRAVLSGITVIA